MRTYVSWFIMENGPFSSCRCFVARHAGGATPVNGGWVDARPETPDTNATFSERQPRDSAGAHIITYASPGCTAIFGNSPEDFLGRDWDDERPQVHPEDRNLAETAVAEVCAEPGNRRTIVYRRRHTDGTYRHLEAHVGNSLHVPELNGLVFNIRDVTSEALAQVARDVAHARLEALVEHSSDAIVITDIDKVVTYSSPAVTKLLGLDAHLNTGRNIGDPKDFIHPDDHAKYLSESTLVRAKPGNHRTFTYRRRGPDNNWTHVECTATNHLEVEGIQGVVTNMRDVTAEVSAAHEQDKLHARLHALVEHSRDVIIVTDENAIVTYASPALEALFGIDPVAHVGNSVADAAEDVHPEDRENYQRVIDEIRSKPGSRDKFYWRRKGVDGTWRVIESNIANHLGVDGIDGIVTNLRDVTAEVAVEAEREELLTRLQALMEHSDDVVVIADAKQDIRYVSPAVERILGCRAEELIGRGVDERTQAIHPEDQDLYQRFMAEVLAAPATHRTFDYRRRHPDGRWLLLQARMTNHLDTDGINGVVVNLRDISVEAAIEAERERSLARLEALLNHNSDVVTILDKSQFVTYASPALKPMFGHKPADVVGTKIASGRSSEIHADDRDAYHSAISAVFKGPGSQSNCTYRHQDLDGRWRIIEVHMTNYLDIEGIDGVVCNMHDITEEAAAKAEVQARNDELSAVLDAFPDQMYRITRDGVVSQSLTPENTRLVDDSGLIGQTLAHVLPGGFCDELLAAIARVCDDQTGETLNCEESELGFSGSRSFEIRISPLPNGEVLASLRDISAQIHTQQQLSYQALHDSLTGLPNRLLFSGELQAALERTAVTVGKVGVLFLDLDGFKAINDDLGHSAGDELLIAVANRLRSAIRPHDTVARLGGDEFVVMCEELTSPDEAKTIAQRVCSLLEEPIELTEASVTVSASIGIAMASSSGEDAETLLAQADSAMYRAKDLGRARAEMFDPNVRRFPHRRVDLESDLKTAIDNGELTVAYLPTIETATLEIASVQVIPCWTHPTNGPIHRDEFLKIIDSAGLSRTFGLEILNTALNDRATWPPEVRGNVKLTIRLMASYLTNEDVAQTILGTLNAAGAPPKAVCFEIAEAAVAGLNQRAVTTLQHLHKSGVDLSIAKFGTGNHSFGATRAIPASHLKLDSSLLADGQLDLIQSTVDLAHQFDLMITVSGVETSEQFEFLRSISCDYVQGPHIADALSQDQLLDFVSSDTLEKLTATLQAPIASPKEQAPPSKSPGAPRATR